MKLFLLHGENQEESRTKLNSIISEAKKKSLEITQLTPQQARQETLLTLAKSRNLLGEKQLVVVENLLSTNQKGGEILGKLGIETQKDYLKNEQTVLVFWERKEIPQGKLKALIKYFKIINYKLPQVLFKFLDSLGLEKAQSIELYREVLKTTPEELLVAMLARQLRLLIWAKEDPETLNFPSWQKGKITSQAARFDEEKLRDLHGKLLGIDKKNKLSQLPENLTSSLELFILSI